MLDIHFSDEEYIDDSLERICRWVEDTEEEFRKSTYFEQLSTHEQENILFLL